MRSLHVLAFILAGYLIEGDKPGEAFAATIGFSRVSCLSKATKPTQAVSSCTSVLQKFKKDTTVLVRRGVAWSDLGELDFAIGDFSRAIALNPKDASAFFHRGLVREKKRQLRESLFDYLAAFDLRPFDQEVQDALDRVSRAFAAEFLVQNTPSNPGEHHVHDGSPTQADASRQIQTGATNSPEAHKARLFLLFPTVVFIGIIVLIAGIVRPDRRPVSPRHASATQKRRDP